MPMQCGAAGFFLAYKTNMEALGLAMGTYTGCGSSAANNGRAALRFHGDTGIRVSPQLHHHIQCHPEIFDQTAPSRRAYAHTALVCDSRLPAAAR